MKLTNKKNDNDFLYIIGTLFSSFFGLSISVIVATIIINIVIFVAGIAGVWWVYNHMVAPSFDIPTLEVH